MFSTSTSKVGGRGAPPDTPPFLLQRMIPSSSFPPPLFSGKTSHRASKDLPTLFSGRTSHPPTQEVPTLFSGKTSGKSSAPPTQEVATLFSGKTSVPPTQEVPTLFSGKTSSSPTHSGKTSDPPTPELPTLLSGESSNPPTKVLPSRYECNEKTKEAGKRPEAGTKLGVFRSRKYKLYGTLSLVISIYKKRVCLQLRREKYGGEFASGVTMNIREFRWLTQDKHPQIGSFARLVVTRQKTSCVVRRVDPPAYIPKRKTRCVTFGKLAYTALWHYKKAIAKDIEDALRHASKDDDDSHEGPEVKLLQNILVVLASRIYKTLPVATTPCQGCYRPPGVSPIFNPHTCTTQLAAAKNKDAIDSLNSITTELLACVLSCNSASLPLKLEVKEIIGGRLPELAEKVIRGEFSKEAERYYDAYYKINRDLMKAILNPFY